MGSIVPCYRGAQCNWPACPQTCVGRPGYVASSIALCAWADDIVGMREARLATDEAFRTAIAAADRFKYVSGG